jgi:hypothetical protein
MKKKNIRRANQENPNQLSFEFLFRESPIDVHIPKTSIKNFDTHFTKNKRLAIKLAQN